MSGTVHEKGKFKFMTSASVWSGKIADAYFTCSAWPLDAKRNEELLRKAAPLKPDPDVPLFTFAEELGESNVKNVKWVRLGVALGVCALIIGMAWFANG